MTINNGFNILPWYDSLEKQNSKKWYAFGQSWPLVCPQNTILPFQFVSSTLISIESNIYAVNLTSGQQLDLGVKPSVIAGTQGGSNYYIVRQTLTTTLATLPVGRYYFKMESSVGTLYSEEIVIVDNTSEYIKLEYWNEDNLYFTSGEINFDEDFRFVLYIPSTIGKPEYEFEEELTKRLGYKFIESQTSNKIYKFNFLAPEYICDAMRLVRMCDYIKLTTKYDTYNALNFSYEPKWQDNGDLAAVDAEFDTDCIIQKLESFNRRVKDSFYNALLAEIDEPVLFSPDTVAQYYTEYTSVTTINGKLIRQLDSMNDDELNNSVDSIVMPVDNLLDSAQRAKKITISSLLKTLRDKMPFLRKDKDDRSVGKVASDKGFEAGTFVKGLLGGTGAWIGADGFAEMTGLTLREFIQVPELRNNRVDVVSGELWNSIAFGLVEKVDEDEQKCWIKLEANELCGLHIGDFCRGIFANFEDGINSEGIDKNNFIQLYGFKTSYFKPIEIVENKKGAFVFKYELCPGTDVHPCASMKFAVYGNEIDPSRRASAYSTRTYKRYLNNVNTWKIDPDKHIYAQYGDLTGLTIGGVEMKGYGSFQSNAYFRGVQIQLPPEQLEELRGESAYSVMLSSSNDVVTVDADGNMGNVYEKLNVVTNGDNVVTNGKNVVTSVFKLKTDVQVRKGSKALYYSTFDAADSYTLSIEPVGCEAVVMNGIIIISNVLDQNNCYVNINVTCEGKSTFRLIYRVTFVKDGKVGKDSLSYRITPNIATLGKTMTGSIDPGSITFKLYKNQGEQSTLFPGLWVLEGRNSSSDNWIFVSSSDFPTETWTCLFKGGYKYYRVQATGSGNSLYDEKEITVVADGKSGSMARYRGEFEFYNDSEPYVYNENYRDVVLYEGNVYQVYAYGSSVTDAPSVSANSDNDGKWQRANQFRFVAMDTALIDNANIAGFTFRRKKYINNSPVGVMRSQYGPICISSVSQDFVSGNEIGITLNGTYTKYVKIRKFNQTAYELSPSVEKIVRRKNSSGEWVYDVSSISCSIKKITEGGSTIVSSVSGYTLKYAKDSGIETSGNSLGTSGATSSITFILYDSNNVEVERQSIPVLSEGDSSVRAIVENETVSMLVDENNEVVSGTPHRFKVSLWKGINEISITNISFSNTSNVEISNEYIEIDTESGAFKCTNAYITGEVNANEGTFRNVEIKNATMKNGLLEAELSSNAVDGYPGISWMYDKTEYARLGMWVVNGQVSGVLKMSNNSAWKESSILHPGMLVLAGKKSGFTSNFETLLSYDGVIFRTENSSYSSGMLVDYAGCLVINSDYWPAESYVADGAVYVDKSGYLKVKNPNRIEI